MRSVFDSRAVLAGLVAACGCVVAASAASASQVAIRAPERPERALRLEFTIGEKLGDDNTSFGRLAGLAAAPDGRLYVLDGQTCVARVFSATGTFLQVLGGPGGGPGEFSCPGVRMEVRGTELVAVHDRSGRVSRFTFDGRHVATTQGRAPPRDSANVRRFAMRHGIDILVVRAQISHLAGPEASRYTTVNERARAEGGRTTRLLRFRFSSAYVSPRGDRSFVAAVSSSFGSSAAWAVHGDSLLAIADGETGRVTWMVATASGMRAVRHDSIPGGGRPVSAADLRSMAESFQRIELTGRFTRGVDIVDAPSVWSVAHRAFFSGDGSLWVGGVAQGGSITWAVFPPNTGAFTTRVPADFWLSAVSQGRLYGYANDTDAGPVVRVYRMQD